MLALLIALLILTALQAVVLLMMWRRLRALPTQMAEALEQCINAMLEVGEPAEDEQGCSHPASDRVDMSTMGMQPWTRWCCKACGYVHNPGKGEG
jgi:hypothetical protein